jgi:hypothetical protein
MPQKIASDNGTQRAPFVLARNPLATSRSTRDYTLKWILWWRFRKAIHRPRGLGRYRPARSIVRVARNSPEVSDASQIGTCSPREAKSLRENECLEWNEDQVCGQRNSCCAY